jgi:hypothetical protein
MIVFSVVASVVLTVLVNLLVRSRTTRSERPARSYCLLK